MRFKAEAGGHRVQRVPATESRGRVHTSTITVVALTEGASTAPAKFDDSEFRTEFIKGSGAGGQHRNKHANSVRMTHLPTGLCQVRQSREREANIYEARQALETLLRQRQVAQRKTVVNAIRRDQAGSGERGDKFRTYRFQDDRVVDERSGRRASAREVVHRGLFDLLWR